MAYRYGERAQYNLLPACIDEYVGSDDPVRAYDAFVDTLDLPALGINLDEEKVGCPQYDPRTMLKLLIYGYSYSADRSSCKLERATYHNLSFMWLLGGLQPDHKTIANFRCKHKDALAQVLKQSVRLCVRLGLIEGNTLFVDGTKLRAAASIKNTWNQERLDKALARTDKRIETLLREVEAVDNNEEDRESLDRLQGELRQQHILHQKVEQIALQLQSSGHKSLNTTDTDCVSTRSIHGSYAGYNAQITVDEKHGLIASCDVVRSGADQGLLSQQVRTAEAIVGKSCTTAVADGGYSDLEDISTLGKDVVVLVPVQHQAGDYSSFIYDETTTTYRCPEGQLLKQYATDIKKKRFRYRITDSQVCRHCSRFGTCTKSKAGRSVGRSFFESTRQRIEQNLGTEGGKAVYKLRAQRVEHPFGHLRRTMGVRSFLLRGLCGVKAEMSLFASAFNIRRMITILGGVDRLISTMRPCIYANGHPDIRQLGH